jgi:hypothetical protein
MLSGSHQVVVSGMDQGEPSAEVQLPVVGVDDAGPIVRVAFEQRSQVILPTRERRTVSDALEAFGTAERLGGLAVREFRAHRVLDFAEAHAAGVSMATRPAFRFSLRLDESGNTRPDHMPVFNMLLHSRPQDRIVYLDHDYEAPELWGDPRGYGRVLLEPGQTWTDEAVHVLPTHAVGSRTFAYRLGRRLTGGVMAVNLQPDEDAARIAREIGATGIQYVYDVYLVAEDAPLATHEGEAARAARSWKIAIPGATNGWQNVPFAPLLVAAVTGTLDRLATLLDLQGVQVTDHEQAHSGGSAGALPGFPATPSQAARSQQSAGTDVLPAPASGRKRWGRRR